MKHSKGRMTLCIAIILIIALIAVGCQQTQPTLKPTATIEGAEATPEAATPEVTAEPTPEPTPTKAPMTYTEDEVNAAKAVVEAYCKDEKLKVSSIDRDAYHTVDNQMKFFVSLEDSKDIFDFIVVRDNADSEWKELSNTRE